MKTQWMVIFGEGMDKEQLLMRAHSCILVSPWTCSSACTLGSCWHNCERRRGCFQSELHRYD